MAESNLNLKITEIRIKAEKAWNDAEKAMEDARTKEDVEVKAYVKEQNAKVKANAANRKQFDIYAVFECNKIDTEGLVYTRFKIHGVTFSWLEKKLIPYPKGYLAYANCFNTLKDAELAVESIKTELSKVKAKKVAPKKKCDAFKTDLAKLMKKYDINSL